MTHMRLILLAIICTSCATPPAKQPAPASTLTDAERVQSICAARLYPPGFADICDQPRRNNKDRTQ